MRKELEFHKKQAPSKPVKALKVPILRGADNVT